MSVRILRPAPRSWPVADLLRIDTGANASAEEAEEGVEDEAQKVNNIVHSFRLQSTSFDKKSYLTYLKGTASPTTTPYMEAHR